MLRTSLLATLGCLMLLREPACSCGSADADADADDDAPCQYEDTPLTAEAPTPWGTLAGEDIAALQIPQPGTWEWLASTDELALDEGGTAFPATALFTPDLATLRLSEHVSGGVGLSCDGPTIRVDGVLTFTNEQDEVFVSIPISAQRMHMGALEYSASGQYSPIASFSTTLHSTREYELMQIVVEMIWIEDLRLHGEFYYHGQSMLTDNSGEGVFSKIATFEADPPP